VGRQTGCLTTCKADSPAAAWYIFFFFGKQLLTEQLFSEKEGPISIFPQLFGRRPNNCGKIEISTMLPQANRAGHSGKRLVWISRITPVSLREWFGEIVCNPTIACGARGGIARSMRGQPGKTSRFIRRRRGGEEAGRRGGGAAGHSIVVADIADCSSHLRATPDGWIILEM